MRCNFGRDLIVARNNLGIMENININLKSIKRDAFSLSHAQDDLITIKGVKGLDAKLDVQSTRTNMNTAANRKSRITIEDNEDFNVELDVRNFTNGVTVDDLRSGEIFGIIENIHFSGLLLGKLDDVKFDRLTVDNCVFGTGTATGMVHTAGNHPISNTDFFFFVFGHSKTGNSAVDLINRPMTNLMFFSCDFRGWETTKQVVHTTGVGIEKVNNLE